MRMRVRWLGVVGLMCGLIVMAGCSQQDAVKTATAIHAYVPTVRALAGDAAVVVEELDPEEAPTLKAVSAKVQAELQELESVSAAYVAQPSAAGWSRMSAVVDALVGDADQGLMTAMAIKNPESKVRAKVALSALDAAMHVVDGYMMAARSPQQAKAVAETRAMKLRNVERYWSVQDRQRVEQALDVHGADWPMVEALGF